MSKTEHVRQLLQGLHTVCSTAHEKGTELLAQLKGPLFKTEMVPLSDCLSVLKKDLELVDDLRKQLGVQATLTQKVLCVMWAQDPLNEAGNPIRTTHCTCSPRTVLRAKIPNKKKDPENFAQFMGWLGVTDLAIEHEAARPHWPGVSMLVTDMVERGEALPDFVTPDALSTDFECTIRRKTEVEELLGNWRH